MQRSEIALVAILVLLILAGTAYQTYHGAPKTAEVIIMHQDKTPFDKPVAAMPAPAEIASPTHSAVPTALPLDPYTQKILYFFNTANQNQLDQITGIGEKTAQKIVLMRTQAGGFACLEDLLKVNGIGEKKLADILEDFRRNPQLIQPRNTPVFRPPVRLMPTFSSQNRILRKTNLQKKSLNTATKEDFLLVPGFGDSLTATILTARQKQGGFKTWADVDKVPGVGKQRLELLQQHFSLPLQH